MITRDYICQVAAERHDAVEIELSRSFTLVEYAQAFYSELAEMFLREYQTSTCIYFRDGRCICNRPHCMNKKKMGPAGRRGY